MAEIFNQFEKRVLCSELVNCQKLKPEFYGGLVQLYLQMDPTDPSVVYLFTNKKRKLLRAYSYAEPKPCLTCSGIDHGTYKWQDWISKVGNTLTPQQLESLLNGEYPD